MKRGAGPAVARVDGNTAVVKEGIDDDSDKVVVDGAIA
jgi:hypothetical protein